MNTKKALDFLFLQNWLKESKWYLAGGTALALSVGHGKSLDLDFFNTQKDIDNDDLLNNFLENNKRHSYLDYLGKKNFSSVTERGFLLEIMGGPEGCKVYVDAWVMQKKVNLVKSDLTKFS